MNGNNITNAILALVTLGLAAAGVILETVGHPVSEVWVALAATAGALVGRVSRQQPPA